MYINDILLSLKFIWTYYIQHTLTFHRHTPLLDTITIGYMGEFKTMFDVENIFPFKNVNR